MLPKGYHRFNRVTGRRCRFTDTGEKLWGRKKEQEEWWSVQIEKDLAAAEVIKAFSQERGDAK